MRKSARFLALAAIAAALSLSACIEAKNTSTVNADGSTKVVIDALLQTPGNMNPMGGGDAKADPAKVAKDAASGFLRDAKGVDAWSDVSTETAKDGRVHVRATAYVSNIDKFKLNLVPVVKWTVDAAGNGKLTMEKEKKNAASAPKAVEKTDEQVKTEIAEARTQFKQMRPMLTPMLAKMKVDVAYVLPGTVSSAVIFTKTGESTANFVMEGRKMLAAMDKFMEDDAALEANIKAGRKADDNEEAMSMQLYGSKGPAEVTVTGATKTQFDFKKECAAAKAKQDAMLKEAGLDLTPKPNQGMPGMGMPGGE